MHWLSFSIGAMLGIVGCIVVASFLDSGAPRRRRLEHAESRL